MSRRQQYRHVKVEELNDLLICDFDAGILTWKERELSHFRTQQLCDRWNTRYAGREALNSRHKSGRLCGSIYFHHIYAHRVVWAMSALRWPSFYIDHINGVCTDNRLSNLREATPLQNNQNVPGQGGTSNFNGVSRIRRSTAWRAQIRHNGKKLHLGTFESELDAAKAFDAAALRLRGEFARLNFPSVAETGQ